MVGQGLILTADLISGARGPVTNRPNPPSDHWPARVGWGAGNEDRGGTCPIICFQRRPPPPKLGHCLCLSRHWYCSAGGRPRTKSEGAILSLSAQCPSAPPAGPLPLGFDRIPETEPFTIGLMNLPEGFLIPIFLALAICPPLQPPRADNPASVSGTQAAAREIGSPLLSTPLSRGHRSPMPI